MSARQQDSRASRTRRGLAAVLALLLVLLAATSLYLIGVVRPPGSEDIERSARAGNLEWVRSIYGFGSTQEEQLNAPNDVAVGPEGTIWVADQARARVLGFGPDGSYETVLHRGPRGSSEDALAFPASLAVDEDGLIYIGDMMKDRVVVMSRDNEILREYYVPGPLSVDVRGDRIVAGSAAGFVIFDKQGEVVRLVGTRGQGDGQFDGVRGVAIAPDGAIFVVDQYNNRISAYDSEGERLWMRETGIPANRSRMAEGETSFETTAEAGLILPARIEVDGSGRLVIVDPFDFSIAVLDAEDGSLIAKHGTYGGTDGQFLYPTGIAFDPGRDWFVVADTGNSRVQIVRISGSGGSATAVVSRTLAGPLSACALPLSGLVLLVALILLVRAMRSRRGSRGGEAPADRDSAVVVGDSGAVTEPSEKADVTQGQDSSVDVSADGGDE